MILYVQFRKYQTISNTEFISLLIACSWWEISAKGEGEDHPEVDENGEPIKEEDGDKKDDKKKANEPVIDWDGAPEFQWKSTLFEYIM